MSPPPQSSEPSCLHFIRYKQLHKGRGLSVVNMASAVSGLRSAASCVPVPLSSPSPMFLPYLFSLSYAITREESVEEEAGLVRLRPQLHKTRSCLVRRNKRRQEKKIIPRILMSLGTSHSYESLGFHGREKGGKICMSLLISFLPKGFISRGGIHLVFRCCWGLSYKNLRPYQEPHGLGSLSSAPTRRRTYIATCQLHPTPHTTCCGCCRRCVIPPAPVLPQGISSLTYNS